MDLQVRSESELVIRAEFLEPFFLRYWSYLRCSTVNSKLELAQLVEVT